MGFVGPSEEYHRLMSSVRPLFFTLARCSAASSRKNDPSDDDDDDDEEEEEEGDG